MTERDLEILLLANRGSPHVAPWTSLYRERGIAFEVFGTHEGPGLRGWRASLRSAYNARRHLKERRRRGQKTIVQAHGAGRAALLARALVDRHPSVVVHGSEVINPASAWKRALTGWVLRRSRSVVITAEATRPAVLALVPRLGRRVHLLHPGPDWALFRESVADAGASPGLQVVAVRRVQPLYRTLELVRAFREAALPQSRLLLLRGDVRPDDPYLVEVRRAAENGGDVAVAEEFLTSDGLARLYGGSEVAVSLAATDQLSMSILEALASGAVVVLNRLDAYRSLDGLAQIVWVDEPVAENLPEALRRAAEKVPAGDAADPGIRRERARDAEAAFHAHHRTAESLAAYLHGSLTPAR